MGLILIPPITSITATPTRIQNPAEFSAGRHGAEHRSVLCPDCKGAENQRPCNANPIDHTCIPHSLLRLPPNDGAATKDTLMSTMTPRFERLHAMPSISRTQSILGQLAQRLSPAIAVRVFADI